MAGAMVAAAILAPAMFLDPMLFGNHVLKL